MADSGSADMGSIPVGGTLIGQKFSSAFFIAHRRLSVRRVPHLCLHSFRKLMIQSLFTLVANYSLRMTYLFFLMSLLSLCQ